MLPIYSKFYILNSKLRGRRGMTLIELLVVIGIMAILTGVMVGYSKQSRNQILLNTEKAKITQAISRTKSLTLTGYTKPTSLPPPCSYGFAVDYTQNKYLIFQYNPPSCQGIGNLINLTTNTDPPFKIIETFTLPAGVNFKQENDSLSHLLFIPQISPRLSLAIPRAPLPNSLKIYLETQDQSLKREIIVSPNGQLSL